MEGLKQEVCQGVRCFFVPSFIPDPGPRNPVLAGPRSADKSGKGPAIV